MPDSARLPVLSLELPRLPCGDHACGVLMCVHTSGRPAKDRAILREAVLSARVLRKFSQPLYPMALIATEDAHAMLSASEAALWEVHRTLRLSGSILAMSAAARGLERKWSRRWERAARLSFVHKLQALLDTPFARTLFVDCDLYVLDGTPIARLHPACAPSPHRLAHVDRAAAQVQMTAALDGIAHGVLHQARWSTGYSRRPYGWPTSRCPSTHGVAGCGPRRRCHRCAAPSRPTAATRPACASLSSRRRGG